MSKQHQSITDEQQAFIAEQKIFFVGTAASNGRVNISPKGLDSFRIINENKIVWLNMTGSGNETAAHLLKNNRMTIMFCAFEGKPLILRLYGQAKSFHERDPEFQQYLDLFPVLPGTRQIIEMEIDLTQDSCGMSVPFMDFNSDREELKNWAEKQGKDKIKDYWKNKNTKSIDQFETDIVEE